MQRLELYEQAFQVENIVIISYATLVVAFVPGQEREFYSVDFRT